MAKRQTIPDTAEPRTSGRRLVAIAVGQFALAGLTALAIVGLATSIASGRVGEREAITDARTTTLIKAKGLVEPVLSDALVTGDPTVTATVSDIVRQNVLDSSLVRVKIWTPEGKIVYSDEPRLIGTTYVLGTDERNAIVSGTIEAEVSDLTKPENRFEQPYGKLLEVYLPVRTPTGKPLLFEAYYRYTTVAVNGARLWRAFAPIAIGALVMLELVQIPLAWSLARRLQVRLRERERLLTRVVQASEVERRQIASDLHDGAVQDLAGVAYALSAAGREEGGSPLAEESAKAIRSSIQELRSLIVDIYPPNFDEVTLESALTDLLARAEDRRLHTLLDMTGMQDPIPNSIARLLYRAGQESIRNVLAHAEATSVRITVRTVGSRVALDVTDDGKGLPAEDSAEGRMPGHVGLTALRGLIADAGGTLDVAQAEPSGVTLRVELPL
ncbi:MAG: sensor histidine kinase [Actinomycetota bacterium]